MLITNDITAGNVVKVTQGDTEKLDDILKHIGIFKNTRDNMIQGTHYTVYKTAERHDKTILHLLKPEEGILWVYADLMDRVK